MRTPKRADRYPSWQWEITLAAKGFTHVAGVDEAGRGPLAGPVVAGAVILPRYLESPWGNLIRDSKLLSPKARQGLAATIKREAISWGIGSASPEEIDAQGIAVATRLAMARAVGPLRPPADYLVVDAVRLPTVPLPQEAVIYGDAKCVSIAAASIVAKVHRDSLMEELDQQFPGYGFAQNKGYGTTDHLCQLERLGPSPIHRRSFAPVSAVLMGLRGLYTYASRVEGW